MNRDDINELADLSAYRQIDECEMRFTAEDIRKAVLAEREACARVCWYEAPSQEDAERMSAAIRARGGAE